MEQEDLDKELLNVGEPQLPSVPASHLPSVPGIAGCGEGGEQRRQFHPPGLGPWVIAPQAEESRVQI